MLTRRQALTVPLLLGCGGAMLATRAGAETAPDGFIVLRATPAGYGDAAPGPVVRARRGDEIKVRLVNALDEPTTIVWHGVRLPSAMEGAPVAPGASFDYRFTVADAGTFWYRAAERSQQERGLYGALIVDEPTPPPVDQDRVLVFAERRDQRNGELQFTLNGASAFDLNARPNERLRLRFVNASATQVMNARIDRHRVVVMALDGEPAEPFTSRDSRIALGPGNRADVFVDATLAPGSSAPVMFMHAAGESPLARIVCEGSPARAAPLGEPAPLAANPLPERMNFARALRVTLPMDRGSAAPPGTSRALFTTERGRTVVMAIENRDATAHSVHLHGHHFRLLDRLDDGWKPYWLDTVLVDGQQTTRIAFVADNPGRWPIEQRAVDNRPTIGAIWFQVA
jgi:FtsP/CotA-like multicopper oxidase with cupredoxin domain